MKCFYHSSVDAVALCNSCGRALCHECIAEVGLSCSCRNRCEEHVAALNDLRERGRSVYQKTAATHFRLGVFASALGAVFMLPGVAGIANTPESIWGYFPLVAGLLFIGLGISNFVSAKKLKQK